MSKYHITPNGEVKACTAQPGRCPYQNTTIHFTDKNEAEQFNDRINELISLGFYDKVILSRYYNSSMGHRTMLSEQRIVNLDTADLVVLEQSLKQQIENYQQDNQEYYRELQEIDKQIANLKNMPIDGLANQLVEEKIKALPAPFVEFDFGEIEIAIPTFDKKYAQSISENTQYAYRTFTDRDNTHYTTFKTRFRGKYDKENEKYIVDYDRSIPILYNIIEKIGWSGSPSGYIGTKTIGWTEKNNPLQQVAFKLSNYHTKKDMIARSIHKEVRPWCRRRYKALMKQKDSLIKNNYKKENEDIIHQCNKDILNIILQERQKRNEYAKINGKDILGVSTKGEYITTK